ncbi:MAG: serine acetyltransferase, partial [Treponema sp.]|nr:serine acetyltransferase [Treponema sp.]
MKNDTGARLKYLTNLLTESYEAHSEIIKVETASQLNRSVIIDIVEKLRCLIFPGYCGKKNISAASVEYYAGDLVEEVNYGLSRQIARALGHSSDFAGLGDEITGG